MKTYTVEEIEKMLEEFFSEPENIDGTPNMSEGSLLGNAATIIRQLLAERKEIEKDAERWRAVIGCARIRNLGCAGIVNEKPDGYAHLGLELWTRHHAPTGPESAQWLIKFADIELRRKAEQGINHIID